jgi:hypothetical protein
MHTHLFFPDFCFSATEIFAFSTDWCTFAIVKIAGFVHIAPIKNLGMVQMAATKTLGMVHGPDKNEYRYETQNV